MRYLVLMIALTIASPAHAWHDEGHVYASLAAVESLPEDVPAFFREGAATVAHGSLDPDVFKHNAAPQLRPIEEPDHYFDLEYLQGRAVPPTRAEFLTLCAEMELDPHKVGTLPYAIAEWAQRLTLAFAEYRRWPDNPHVRMKCLIYAGILSHYTADAAMPLHTTWHWDGRVDEAGKTSHTGIHLKVDALPTKLPYNTIYAEPLPAPEASADVFAEAIEQIQSSNTKVDRVYELEASIPDLGDMTIEEPTVRDFTVEQMQDASAYTATVIYSAWVNSADIELPFWLDRPVFDETLDRTRVPPQPRAGE